MAETDGARERLANLFTLQAGACEMIGSPLYAELLGHAAQELLAGEALLPLLEPYSGARPMDVVPLRLLGGLHRLVLEGRADDLARFYPSAGGSHAPGRELGEVFLATVAANAGHLRPFLDVVPQTNEVARCAALLGGFLRVAERFGLPLRLLEVGTAAGLLLRWDQYRYDAGEESWGDPASPVRFEEPWLDHRPALDVTVVVEERLGCDLHPIDATSDEGRLRLLSYVWPDMVERLRQLDAAIEVARSVPAVLDEADVFAWLPARLAERPEGVTSVVFDSVVLAYWPDHLRERYARLIAEEGEAATRQRPLAWLSLAHPGFSLPTLTLRTWPGGEVEELAVTDAQGKPPIRWLAR